MLVSRRSAISALSLAAITARASLGSDWPSWRGPSRDGVTSDSLPDSFANLEELWSIELADSYSGPVVHAGQVLTTETVNQKNETLKLLNCANGEVLWQKEWEGAMSVPFFAKSNGDWIRSTPATDGQYVVVGGMCDVVACFSLADGAELWRYDYPKQEGVALPSFGLVCSPLIDGDSVYMQAGGFVRRIRLQDGELVWKSVPDDGGMSGGAFSSPIIATLCGKRQLVVQTRTKLCGVDLETGNELWSQEIASFRGMNILTPTIHGDSVFTSSYGGRSTLLAIECENDQWKVSTRWETKAEAYMSSPVVIGENIYMHLRNSRFTCIDLNTGEERWRTTPFGKYWSMITDGKRIVALDETGELLLINGNPESFELLDRKQISSESTWAHLALAGDQLFVRRQHGLAAYRWQA